VETSYQTEQIISLCHNLSFDIAVDTLRNPFHRNRGGHGNYFERCDKKRGSKRSELMLTVAEVGVSTQTTLKAGTFALAFSKVAAVLSSSLTGSFTGWTQP
jgi:hypothetical protein